VGTEYATLDDLLFLEILKMTLLHKQYYKVNI